MMTKLMKTANGPEAVKMNTNTAKRIRLIAVDLDRTALRTDKSLSPAVSDALQKASQQGMEVVIVSGRPFESLPAELIRAGFIRYAVTSNGAAVYDLDTGSRIAQTLLRADQVRSILNLFPDMKCFEVLLNGKSYAWDDYVRDPARFGTAAEGIDYIRKTRTGIGDIRAFALKHEAQLDAMDIICREDFEREQMTKKLKEYIPSVFVTSSVRNLIEISAARNGKAQGLKLLSERLHIDPSEMIAFGDAHNDLEMIEYAGTGVAMGNASREIKDAADLVTLTNDEDGVAVTVRTLLEKQS